MIQKLIDFWLNTLLAKLITIQKVNLTSTSNLNLLSMITKISRVYVKTMIYLNEKSIAQFTLCKGFQVNYDTQITSCR